MENHWHICTDGLEKNVIFKGDGNYIYGMNSIPVCAVGNQVTILAFCLMSNHVHFIVRGKEGSCRQFITQYKKRLATLADLSSTDVCVKRIDDSGYLMRAIGYVLRNPVSAGIRIMPYHYEWSSALLYFRPPESKCPGHRIGSLSYRTRRNILHSQTDLLDAFLINDNGLILPECYVDILSVENLFRSPARLMYALSRNENLEMELTGDILRKRMPDNFGCWADTGLCRTHDVKIEAPVHLAKLHIWLSTSCKRYRTFDPFQTGQMCSTPSQCIDYQSLSFTYCTAVSKKIHSG